MLLIKHQDAPVKHILIDFLTIIMITEQSWSLWSSMHKWVRKPKLLGFFLALPTSSHSPKTCIRGAFRTPRVQAVVMYQQIVRSTICFPASIHNPECSGCKKGKKRSSHILKQVLFASPLLKITPHFQGFSNGRQDFVPLYDYHSAPFYRTLLMYWHARNSPSLTFEVPLSKW